MPLEVSLPYRALLWSLRLAWAGVVFGVVMMLAVLVLRADGVLVLVRIGFAEALGACVIAVPAFAMSLPKVTSAILDEPRTLGRRADAVVACVLADLLDPEWS